MLKSTGVPDECLPSDEAIAYGSAVFCLAVVLFLLQWRRRIQLYRRLAHAEERVRYLKERLLEGPVSGDPRHRKSRKEVRIFMDGAFDMLHYGHMNAFRLARSLGTHLVVGVNSDESITECKGAPMMNDGERLTMVSACKFVDEVVPDCPYVMNREYLDYVIEKYNIDYVVHGDDPCFVDGKDVYEAAKQAGKFKTIPRTEGVSTTDIVGRMLLMTKEHHLHSPRREDKSDDNSSVGSATAPSDGSDSTSSSFRNNFTVGQHQSKFFTTSRMLQLFSAGVKAPTKDMHVVYIDGAWDLFHPGHVSILKAAREVRRVRSVEMLTAFSCLY